MRNKVWKLSASRLMGVLSGSPGGRVDVRARQIVAIPPQVAPRLPALGRRRSFSRSLLRYVPEHSAAFWKVTPELETAGACLLSYGQHTSYFCSWLESWHSRWGGEGGMERKRPPHSLFHTDWLRCVHFNFGSERRKTRGCLQNSLTDLNKSFSSKLRGIIADSSHPHLNLESVRSTEESQS